MSARTGVFVVLTVLLVGGLGVGGYLVGEAEAPTAADAAEVYRTAYAEARTAAQRAGVQATLGRGEDEGLSEGRARGAEEGRRAGKKAGGKAAGEELAAAEAEAAAAAADAAAAVEPVPDADADGVPDVEEQGPDYSQTPASPGGTDVTSEEWYQDQIDAARERGDL